MKRSLFRFLLVFAPVLGLIAWGSAILMDRIQDSWIRTDLAKRSALIFSSIEEELEQALASGETQKIERLLNRISRDELLLGVLVCPEGPPPPERQPLVPISNETLSPALTCDVLSAYPASAVIPIGPSTVYMRRYSLKPQAIVHAKVYIISNAAIWLERSQQTRLYIIGFFIVLGFVVVMVSTLIARWTITRPMRDLGILLRDVVRFGNPKARLRQLEKTEFAPLIHDIIHLTREVQRLRITSPSAEGGIWTSERLRTYVKRHFENLPLCVISNREPLTHNFNDDQKIEMMRPASGLVTGVEPVVKACNGFWIAHGSGSADKDVVDANDCVAVTQDKPEYTLRRVWLPKEVEEGYYYGFSNEGLWPLCHIAHQRPQFESNDWESYIHANQLFAQSFAKQFGKNPAVVLIQDYHFSMLPRFIREVSPHSIILLFWHIPWPNPEAFGICPWRNEIIESMLQADVMGFHTQFHCNNFIDTVDRYVESKIDREFLNVQLQGHECRIRSFPISVSWESESPSKSLHGTLTSVRESYRLPPDTILGLGVDRIDYTKGLPERIRGIRRFAERRPDLAKRFAFVQIGSPSRTQIPAYQKLNEDIESLVAETNQAFQATLGRDLIYLRRRHHHHEEIKTFYQQANLCLVTPLHDGMNLVAKEYVVSRTKEDGVLILSQFAGASRELREALIVNPYGPDDIANKLIQACEMTPEEQRDRMRRMMRTVRENNVYKWAYLQLRELSDVHQMVSLSDRER